MEQEQKMTEEEMQKEVEKQKKEWQELNKLLKDNPDQPVTKAELAKVIDFISNDISGIAQMTTILSNNMNVIHREFTKILSILGVIPSENQQKRTKNGIIIP